MATKKTSSPSKTPKAPKPEKAKKLTAAEGTPSEASVGPIDGTLEEQSDEIKNTEVAKTRASKKNKIVLEATLTEQFEAIRKTLNGSNSDKKQPRKLRWAQKALDAAEHAALLHVKHNA